MAREFSKAFYHSKVWKETRESYFRSKDGLCEKCMSRGILKTGEIVHHKIHLTPRNIDNPDITLSFDNLELVCRDCHAEEHPEIYKSRYKPSECRVTFDDFGNIVKK